MMNNLVLVGRLSTDHGLDVWGHQ